MRHSLSRLLKGLALSAIVATAACGGSNDTENRPVTTTTDKGRTTSPTAAEAESRDHALVRVIHAIPAGATVDLYADDNAEFRGLAYKTITPYKEVDGGRHIFRLRPAGMNTAEPLAENREGLRDGEYYTVVVLPGDGKEPALIRVVDDDVELPDGDKARVRVVHASRDAREIDVFVHGREDALFDGVDFQTVSAYHDIDPIATTLEVRADDATSPMLTVPNVTFEAGKSYTVVIVGQLRSAPKLEAFIVEDQVGMARAEPVK